MMSHVAYSMSPVQAERPRSSLPSPYQTTSAKATKEETIRSMRDKLSDFKAENQLLGKLLSDAKVQKESLSKRLSTTQKQLQHAQTQAADAMKRAHLSEKEEKRLKGEVQRLTSIVQSHSIRLERAKQNQKDVEELALDLREQLDASQAAAAAAQGAADKAARRAEAAEAKLEAVAFEAGQGGVARMSISAEQLIVHSSQRARELQQQLEACQKECETHQAAATQQLKDAEAKWQQQLDEATQAAARAAAETEQALAASRDAYQVKAAQVVQLQQQLAVAQAAVAAEKQHRVDGKTLAQAELELQQLQSSLLQTSSSQSSQVVQLQQQLAACEALQEHCAREAAEQVAALQQGLQQQQAAAAAAERQVVALRGALVVARQQETSHRLLAKESTVRAERLRGEVVRGAEALQQQAAATEAAAAGAAAAEAARAEVEDTLAACRQELDELRRQLLQLATATMRELREQVAGEAVAITGLPTDDCQLLPAAVQAHIKVLEGAVCEGEVAQQQLLENMVEQQQLVEELQQRLAAARRQHLAAEKALAQQMARLQALENMRLQDLREVQRAEQALMMSQQECHSLRDLLVAARLETAQAGGQQHQYNQQYNQHQRQQHNQDQQEQQFNQQQRQQHNQDRQQQYYDLRQQQQRQQHDNPGPGSRNLEVASQNTSVRPASSQTASSTEAAVAAAMAAAAACGWLSTCGSGQPAAPAAEEGGGKARPEAAAFCWKDGASVSGVHSSSRRRSNGSVNGSQAAGSTLGPGTAAPEGYHDGEMSLQGLWEQELDLMGGAGGEGGKTQSSSRGTKAPPPAHALLSNTGGATSRPLSSSSESSRANFCLRKGPSRTGRQKGDASGVDVLEKENIFAAAAAGTTGAAVSRPGPNKQVDRREGWSSERLDNEPSWIRSGIHNQHKGTVGGGGAATARDQELAPPLELEESLLATYMA